MSRALRALGVAGLVAITAAGCPVFLDYNDGAVVRFEFDVDRPNVGAPAWRYCTMLPSGILDDKTPDHPTTADSTDPEDLHSVNWGSGEPRPDPTVLERKIRRSCVDGRLHDSDTGEVAYFSVITFPHERAVPLVVKVPSEEWGRPWQL